MSWTLEISETINSDNWFDTNYPDPDSGSLEITLEYVCSGGEDAEKVNFYIMLKSNYFE